MSGLLYDLGRGIVHDMEQFVTGFWGCFFGMSALLFAGSVFAFMRSLHRVAINAALSAVASAFFASAFLGALPIKDPGALARLLAHVACGVSAMLMYFLLTALDLFRPPVMRRCVMAALVVLTVAVMAAGWLLVPRQALELALGQAGLLAVVAFAASARTALRGDRLARAAVASVAFMLAALIGLSWIALNRADAPWFVHIVSAVAGTGYLATLALLLWSRYAYLIELHQVMAYGPAYDPVTRMRSHAETGQMVGEAFKQFRETPVPLGVIVFSIANFYTLEKLYGLGAANHALFVCASRLRRMVPPDVAMGRLADDSFLLLVHNCHDSGGLIDLARSVQARLCKPVVLHTRAQIGDQSKRQTRWAAEVGAGVLRASKADARAATVVAMARGISRTAWSYPSRVGWLDEASGHIVGMPVLRPR